VNLKRGGEPVGQFDYESILAHLKDELDELIASKAE
jgi:hypothetical protein